MCEENTFVEIVPCLYALSKIHTIIEHNRKFIKQLKLDSFLVLSQYFCGQFKIILFPTLNIWLAGAWIAECRYRRADRLKHLLSLFSEKVCGRFGGGGGFAGFHENVPGVRELVGGGLQERRLLQHQWLAPVTNSCNAWTLVSASFSSREVPF